MATPDRGLLKGPRPAVANCQVMDQGQTRVRPA